jgi:hypothetical protein
MPQNQTSTYGKTYNNPFSLYPDEPTQTVKKIDIWSGWSSGDSEGYWVVKGIKLTWFNGQVKDIYRHPGKDDKHDSYEFEADETANWSVWAGWRINKLQFSSSKGILFDAGAESGTEYSNVANGALVGFEGDAGWEFDSISIRYQIG